MTWNTKDNLADYETSREKLVAGINKATNILKPTYGPNGGNVAIEVPLMPFHGVYNDGKRILDTMFLEDPIEQMGLNMLREASDKQEKECGDGRKTTAILTAAILNEGLKVKDKSPLQIKRELDEVLPKILAAIDENKRDILIEDIGKIARIASESDEIAVLIGEIYPKIGRDGVIEVESSSTPETFYEVVNGIRLYGAQRIIGKSEIEGAKVLIVKDKIASKAQLEKVYATLKGKVKEVVLYCDEVEYSVLATIARTNTAFLEGQDVILTTVIKAPVMFKDWLFDDLAVMSGATPIQATAGVTFNNFKLEYLGEVKSWKAEKDESRLNGTKDISEHIKEIERQMTEEKKEQFKVRLNWLNTKVAILKVGANSESELSWKIKKTIDASNASRLALKDGVVKGGGIGLADVSVDKDLHQREWTHTEIGKVIKTAVWAPLKQIEANSGSDTLWSDFGDKVIDPAVVIKSAITTAISLAGIILTIKGALVVPEHIKQMVAMQQQQRMPH